HPVGKLVRHLLRLLGQRGEGRGEAEQQGEESSEPMDLHGDLPSLEFHPLGRAPGRRSSTRLTEARGAEEGTEEIPSSRFRFTPRSGSAAVATLARRGDGGGIRILPSSRASCPHEPPRKPVATT